MFTRPGRIAGAAFFVIAVCAALARCGGHPSPTEPGRAPDPTPSPVSSPTSTPSPTPPPTPTAGPTPIPLPTPASGTLFGFVRAVSGATQQYLPDVVLMLHQDGVPDQVTSSGSGSLDGYYAFCCLRLGPATISATLGGYAPFSATINVSQTPIQYDIRMVPDSGAPAPPTSVPVPVPPMSRRGAAVPR